MARNTRFRHRPRLDGKFSRKNHKEPVGQRVLIVCEGKKTEPEYFKKLRSSRNLTSVNVRITGDCDPAPINVVEFALEILNKDDDYEFVCLVFDRDRHTTYDDAILKARNLKEKRSRKKLVTEIITSVPCFEIWYLWHVSKSSKPYTASTTGGSPADELLKELKKQANFQNYDKSNCSFFDNILGNVYNAVQQSIRSIEEAKKHGEKEYHENPSTRVHKVIEIFDSLAK